ncbi:MAG: PEP-CTERM sorting domain-containing protein [Luteolibacter sp.]|uniref:PEP-CTERM sorting domain-containing protein n=1 Tax=Luteolibacter sp. TaxID=1962973 RepID=UPI003266F0F6
MKSFICLFALCLPLSAAVTYSLPGSTEKSTWILNSTNYPSATYRTFGTANLAWGAPAAPTSGTSSAVFNKVSGYGYMSGSGFMYTAGEEGFFSITDSSPLASLQTIVLQGGISDPFASIPVLNYNGGSQAIAADYFSVFTGSTYPDRVWQWDLSAIAGPITSYEIQFSGHFAATSLTIDTSDSYLQVIPEPSTGLLGIAAIGLTLIRRRRA